LEEYKAQLDEEIIASNKAIIKSIRSAREMASGFAKRLPQRPATERWEPAKRLPTAAESAASMAKDREDKEERLRKAREADRKEEEARKEEARKEEAREEAVFRSHAAAALEIEAAKEQDEILEDTRTTRSAITIDDEDEEVTIDDLPPSSTAPAALGSRSKRARAGTVDYRALAGLSRTREEIECLNQEAERKKKAKAAKMALRSPVKKKSRFIDAKAFERK
jgi:IgA-specific serine endopeptidase